MRLDSYEFRKLVEKGVQAKIDHKDIRNVVGREAAQLLNRPIMAWEYMEVLTRVNIEYSKLKYGEKEDKEIHRTN